MAAPNTTTQTADAILAVVESYRLKASPFDPAIIPQSRETFLPLIERAVEQQQSVPFTLPAFPFKSPNTADKVLGVLPDKAEEVSLLHLQGFCNNVRDVYPHGAELTIVSDGIVYSDLLGVSDATVWAYGERLREMASELSCTSLRFARLSTMLKGKLPAEVLEYHDTESYEKAAPVVREALVASYTEPGYDVSANIAEDESVKATYRGYLKYLATDLAEADLSDGARKAFKRRVSKVAKQMIARGKCYAACVKEAFPEFVRLSIHAANSATKIPISVVPNAADRPVTPWHCVMTCRLDGALVPLSRKDAAARDDLELVHRDGRPWSFREKSSLYDSALAAGASIEHTYPCGLLVAFPRGTPFAVADMRSVRALADYNSPVVLRGLDGTTDRPAFLAKGREMGEIMKWKFGELLEVKDGGEHTRGLNNVLSTEPMPFHYDGLFKMVNGVSTPPHYQMFVAVTASPKGTGHTLFASSARLFQHLHEWTAETLKPHTWRVDSESFEGSHFGQLPLVVEHPVTGVPCIRYHEDWPQERTRFQETRINIEGVDAPTDVSIRTALEKALYDWRVCLRVGWEQGDILVNDNILTMHTREGYTSQVGRELWRLHVD
ncbi:putative pyoverdine/dityrosine biosynthesis protein [Auricularia subglabra TFB-10046 SS5]|nr:putative pyoverdine/dityrosine biosynthesis protein [Auricularia subglabra TFB-10046 SS5]